MAAITTAAAGAWSSTGTWTGGVVPGNGDTVTINHAVSVTDSRTVGTSPAAGSGTDAIRLNAVLTIASGGTLKVRGDIGQNNVGIVVQAGGIFEWDASAAASPSTARYVCRGINASDPSATLTVTGTSGSHGVVRSNAGGAAGRFVDNNNDRSGRIIAEWCDFTRVGDASNAGFSWIAGDGEVCSFTDCVFDTCGSVGDKSRFSSSAQSQITYLRCRWVNSVGDSAGPVCDARSGTGIRLMSYCTFDAGVFWYSGGGVAGWTINNCQFLGGYDTTGGKWTQFKNNLIALPIGAEVGCFGVMENCYVLRLGAPTNPHYVAIGDTTDRITGSCFECPDGTGSESDGDCMSFGSFSSARSVPLDHNIIMHRSDVNPGTLFSCLGNANVTLSAEHNTFHGGQGAYVGETYPGHAGMISSFKNNLAFVKSGSGFIIKAEVGTATNVVLAANCINNGRWNTSYDSNLSFSSGTPGAGDVVGNPSFVDVDRTIKTWDSSLGGPGTVANALNEIALGNRTILALWTYVRAGYTPTNAAFHASTDNVALSNGWIGAVGPDPVLEQEGFRFYNDDGSETTATAMAAQDANVTAPAGTNLRPRILVNSVNDPAAFSAQLEHRLNGGSWGKTEVPSGSLAFGSIGAATTTGTTAPTVAYPASIAAGDLLVLAIVNRPNAQTPSTPSGWTAATNYTTTGGAGSEAADTGTVRITVFTKLAVGTESGSLTLAVTSGTSVGAVMLRVPRCPGKVFDLALVNGSDNSAGTGWSVTMGANPGIDAGDLLYVFSGCSADTPTFASEALSATGATFGSMTERLDRAITTGNDCKLVVAEFPVSTGPASAAPVYTMTASGTASGSAAGASILLRIRMVTAAVTISPSSNITASGQNTTARLTAPSGKTTSDFVAGRIQDDENPADSVDISTDDYSEFEWSVIGNAALLTNGDVIDFRVTRSGVLLDTYTVTPSWTIGTSGAGAIVGSAAGAGTATGSLAGSKGTLAGTGAGVGGGSATLQGTGQISGTAAGGSTCSATATGKTALAGTAAGAGAAAGALTGQTSLTGTATGSSTPSATLQGTGNLSGTSAGSATASGSLGGPGSIAGSAAGSSTCSGTLTGLTALVGNAAGAGAGSATLLGTGYMVGSSAGSATASGNPNAPTGDIAGTAAGSSTCTGTLVGIAQVSGAAAGGCTVTGTLTGQTALSGTAAGLGGGTATLTGIGYCIGNSAGSSTATGIVGGPGAIVGTAAGSSTCTGTLTGLATLTGTSAGVGGGSATIAGLGQITGVAAGSSTITGAGVGIGVLSAVGSGSSTATGLLRGTGYCSGTSAGRGTATLSYSPAGKLRFTITVTPGYRGRVELRPALRGTVSQ